MFVSKVTIVSEVGRHYARFFRFDQLMMGQVR